MIMKHIRNLTNKKIKKLHNLSYIIFFLYCSLMLWEVFIGPYRSYSGLRRYNLYPFKTIVDFALNTSHYTVEAIFINLAANIITFIPLGFFIPLLFQNFRKFKSMILLSITIILIIELNQFTLNVGVLDIDDVILNTLGCILGFITYNSVKRICLQNK